MRRMYIKFIDAICDLRNVFLISAGIVISVLTIYFLRYELLKALIKMDGGIGRFKRKSGKCDLFIHVKRSLNEKLNKCE